MINYFKFVVYLIVLIGFSFANAGSYEDFFEAIERDKASEVQGLLLRGFDPNTVNESGKPGLMLAIAASSWATSKVLIAHPAIDINVRNRNDETPLMLAALKGNVEICQMLLKRDADVNKKGWAPLHYAATHGGTEVIALLLEHYAYIDADSPNKTTPLMMAAMYGSSEAVKLLIEAGADVALKNSLGLSALDFAKRSERPEVVELIASAIRASRPQGSW